ncbi:MAG TPA: SulP family inorganic anion transporter [Pseudomonas sp.]|uniref:SulP family inorganic anion transporter n=1 Tax=Pseudomonas sp. TaxID=306 RepID=UPI002CDA0456|nr:SulP family inorganic anion transporter [Pseudomonas sp.]HRL93141.1 SulP family inorganic anion transporter [Pseudomonas sp.]
MHTSFFSLIGRIAPGLHDLRHYQRADLPKDLAAGLAVAAVALPVGVAYAQLAGFHPAVGLYSSILPLLAYFLFGTSRQLILGPDAATCALIALTVAPMAGGDPQVYIVLSALLALFAGLFCILACFLKLGALADFLSRPILVGFLNGVAVSIALGQSGKLFGFSIEQQGVVLVAIELISKFGQIHWLTFAVALLAFAVLLLAPRLIKHLPAALLAMLVTAVAVAGFDLEAHGVATLGVVPAGLPALGLPAGSLQLLTEHFKPLLMAAAGIALISFSSAMLTARSFAAKNRYDIDVDREFAALGAANIASALSQGFAISGADSRTAMSDASGGRTRLTGLFAAAAVALVLVFLTGPLQFVPVAALGAVLIMAALSLLDLGSLQRFWAIDKREFLLSMIATFGVIWVGALEAILFVVLLAVLRFVQLTARPRAEVLGSIEGMPGFHALDRHPEAAVTAGLVLFRFNGPLVFFNAGYFKREALAAANQQGDDLRWFVLDMIPLTQLDITGIDALLDLQAELASRGVELVAAGRRSESSQGVSPVRHYPTLRKAQQAYRKAFLAPAEPGPAGGASGA